MYIWPNELVARHCSDPIPFRLLETMRLEVKGRTSLFMKCNGRTTPQGSRGTMMRLLLYPWTRGPRCVCFCGSIGDLTGVDLGIALDYAGVLQKDNATASSIFKLVSK